MLHERTGDPWWSGAVPDLEHVTPPSSYADAWSFTAPVIDMPVYLPLAAWPARRARRDVTRMALAALPQTEDVVVNCAGLGSRRLAGDLDVHPVRGQVVLVEGVTLDHWWLDSAGPTYVVPRSDTVVVGGTDQDGDWSRTPSPETAADDPADGRPGWCRSSPRARGWSPIGSVSGRCVPSYDWRRKVGSSTATATVARA